MKKTALKLIPALCMLLISAMMLGTTTYAWFSMNTHVTAGNIRIEAKSNAMYLLINQSANAHEGSEHVDLTESGAVYPAKFLASAATVGSASVPDNGWYTANNRHSSSATDSVYNQKVVSEGDADYMLASTMYLTLSNDSEDWAHYIKVTVNKTAGDAASSIVLKVTNGSTTTYFDANQIANGGSTTFYIDCTGTNLTKNDVITVVVYTYIDGTSTNVYSDFTGAPSSLNGTFDLEFDLSETNS